jgi:hypothetical protein
MKRSTAISEHLKKVEINCQKVDGTVLKVLKFLCAFNICKITCNAPHSFIFFLTFTVMSIYVKESLHPSKLVRKSWMVGPKVPIYRWISTFCHEFSFYSSFSLALAAICEIMLLPVQKGCSSVWSIKCLFFISVRQFFLWDMKYPRILWDVNCQYCHIQFIFCFVYLFNCWLQSLLYLLGFVLLIHCILIMSWIGCFCY